MILTTLDGERALDTIKPNEAKSNLSRQVERTAAGEEVIIAKADRPLGLMRGLIWIGDHFDDPLPEQVQDTFDGKCP